MRKRILIVDDSDMLRESLRATLESELGVTCSEASDGRDAVNRALDLKPDLIVLDLLMPRMNGLDAAPHLKRLLPSVPLVMFTSFDGDAVQASALAVGISRLVNKDSPYGLVAAIRALLPTAA